MGVIHFIPTGGDDQIITFVGGLIIDGEQRRRIGKRLMPGATSTTSMAIKRPRLPLLNMIKNSGQRS